ncbi:alpha-1,2-fucosyltransferase [Paludisphaera mucosa]|uniref:Alpha-1,2-fucosyltransferase n=1 Tax=Paludisphaera mucosa TaxID=3030827 RepID=A0ABT6FIT3_9BACT|nr:alpha-1,2-fucosyltransferase [Paludisphaera mucosa]MDG3007482.1 alpha-1,2-fucosyltransferase [Paludisphaera mucosa]
MIAFSKLGRYGRLGNQLFQYAYLRTTARRLGTKFYCPTWDGDAIFDLRDEDERALEPSGIVRSYDPHPEAGYTPEALKVGDGTEIQGYFQSEKYYDDPAAVRDWYTFREPVVAEARRKYGHLPLRDFTSFSLRLDDDYNNIRDYLPLYPVRYYEQADRRLGGTSPLLIFADGPARAREFLKGYPTGGREMIFVEGLGGPEQLYLMTQCGANVITNSTFAWWGAWLNAAPGSRIVAPSHWNRPGIPIPIRDILCESWIKVPGTIPVWDHFQVWRLRHPVALMQRVRAKLRKAR